MQEIHGLIYYDINSESQSLCEDMGSSKSTATACMDKCLFQADELGNFKVFKRDIS